MRFYKKFITTNVGTGLRISNQKLDHSGREVSVFFGHSENTLRIESLALVKELNP